jgi:hypothetical protein
MKKSVFVNAAGSAADKKSAAMKTAKDALLAADTVFGRVSGSRLAAR